MKECDIVKIKKLNLEGMVICEGFDLETHQKKYQVYIDDGDIYFCLENEIEFIREFDDMIDGLVNENSNTKNYA